MVRVRVKYMILYIFIPYSSRYLRFFAKNRLPTPYFGSGGGKSVDFRRKPHIQTNIRHFFTVPTPPC